MSQFEVKWADPPPAHNGKWGEAQRFLAELKNHPGRWALYDTRKNGPGSTGARMRSLGYEVTSRKNGEFSDIYVRWPES